MPSSHQAVCVPTPHVPALRRVQHDCQQARIGDEQHVVAFEIDSDEHRNRCRATHRRSRMSDTFRQHPRIADGDECGFCSASGRFEPAPRHLGRSAAASRQAISSACAMPGGGGVQWRPGCLKKEARVLSALVGRDRELGVLLGCLDEAQQGRASLVVCVGGPGIGKTRLVEELTGRARERGVLTAWGRAAMTDGAPPYWPWQRGLAGAGRRRDGRAGRRRPSCDERCRAVAGGARAEVRRGGTARARGRAASPAARRPRRFGRRGRTVAAVGAVPRAHGTRRPSPCRRLLPRHGGPYRHPGPGTQRHPGRAARFGAGRRRRAGLRHRRASGQRRRAGGGVRRDGGQPVLRRPSLPVSWPRGPGSRGPYPGRCSTRSASASDGSPRTARRRCVPRRCSVPGSRCPSSQR